jgi:hypothetical protein
LTGSTADLSLDRKHLSSLRRRNPVTPWRRTVPLLVVFVLGCGGGGGGPRGPVVIETATLVQDSRSCTIRGQVLNRTDVPCGASLRFELFNRADHNIGSAFVEVPEVDAKTVALYEARAFDNGGAELDCGPIDHFDRAVVAVACPPPPP